MKNKTKNMIIGILIGIMMLLVFIITVAYVVKENKEKELYKQRELLLKEIKTNYNEHVITTKTTALYKKEQDKYIKVGKVSKEVELELEDIKLTHNTKHFLIDDLGLYVSYKDIKPIDELEKNDSYENYIYFNKNIITKNDTKFYNYDNELVYEINKSYDFKVLVMDDTRYGIEFNDELLFINKDDVEKIYDNHNTDEKNKSKIRTLTYHFLYNPATEKCNQIICHTLEQFESHLKYISENEYFSLNLTDLELYLSGKIQIPEKSIVLTIDDGTMFDLKAMDLLDKYDVTATLFVVTSWIPIDVFTSKNLYLESHTHNMHNQYECPGYGSQGGGILCLDEEYVLNDLKQSQDILGGSKYLAYPFYDFNDRAISLLKKAGFKMAFIGQYDTNGCSFPNQTDLFKVRRTTILSTTTMNEFINYLN